MILYFDNYITDVAFGTPKPVKENFRTRAPIYAMPSRLEISKYVLESYSVYPWSHVLIKYQIDDPKADQEFGEYAKKLFPKAIVINHRSATQAEYRESIKLLDQMPDDWIFYAPNNDHVLLLNSPEKIGYLDRLIKKAEKYVSKYDFVVIPYSVFSVYINSVRPGRLNFGQFNFKIKFLEEDLDAVVVSHPHGDFNSINIVNKKFFRHCFNSVDLGNKRVIRFEDVVNELEVKEQVIVVPKIELAAHFEGYEHMLGGLYEIRPDQIPSLFIPTGFFERNIRIAYGYSNYRPGWVNINPMARCYSFDDLKHGADLKIGLQDIPFFWKERISEIDVNPQANATELERGRQRTFEILHDPWAFKNQGYNFKTLRFRLKRPILKFYPWFEKRGLVPLMRKLKRIFGFY